MACIVQEKAASNACIVGARYTFVSLSTIIKMILDIMISMRLPLSIVLDEKKKLRLSVCKKCDSCLSHALESNESNLDTFQSFLKHRKKNQSRVTQYNTDQSLSIITVVFVSGLK